MTTDSAGVDYTADVTSTNVVRECGVDDSRAVASRSGAERMAVTNSCLVCGTPPPAGGYRFDSCRVVRCATCGVWFETPRPAEETLLEAYRADAYFEGGDGFGYDSYRDQEATLRCTFRAFLRTLARHSMTGGKLMEIGCGLGYFLAEAGDYFSYRAGTDYGAGAVARAAASADDVYVGGVEAVPSDARFDTIVMIHVIEHVYHPAELIAHLRRLLVPGGWVVVATPHIGSVWRYLMGRRWAFFKIPEHLSYYTPSTLKRLLSAAGYQSVRSLPYVSYFSGDLIASKLGLQFPAWAGRRRFRVPLATIACAGRNGTDGR